MYIILVLIIIVAVATMSGGVILRFRQMKIGAGRGRAMVRCSLSSFAPLMAAAVILLIPGVAQAADGANVNSGYGYIAAALSTGLATVGTGIAVGSVGSSALGAVSEDPKILGRTLIFVGLAEGIAIYGLIVSIMILGRI
jgi:V/A-type H+-transporting ATPase subunit K